MEGRGIKSRLEARLTWPMPASDSEAPAGHRVAAVIYPVEDIDQEDAAADFAHLIDCLHDLGITVIPQPLLPGSDDTKGLPSRQQYWKLWLSATEDVSDEDWSVTLELVTHPPVT